MHHYFQHITGKPNEVKKCPVAWQITKTCDFTILAYHHSMQSTGWGSAIKYSAVS